ESRQITSICDETFSSWIDQAAYPLDVTYPNQRYRVAFVRQQDDPATQTYYRRDWAHEWLYSISAQNFFMRSRLKEIQVQHDANSNGNFSDDPLIRKYTLVYANDLGTMPIFPNYVWNQGGQTLTLVKIEEYGYASAGPLPATTFTYGDNLHLTQGTNGYGGQVTYQYESWNDVQAAKSNTLEQHFGAPGNPCVAGDDEGGWSARSGGNVHCTEPGGDLYVQGTGTKGISPGLLHPGGVYELYGSFKAVNQQTDGWANLGLYNGSNDVYQGAWISQWAWTPITVTLGLSTTASQNSAFLINCNHCTVSWFRAKWLPTYYRVTAKTVTDAVTTESSTVTYQYDEPATNDAAHSEAVKNSANDDVRYAPAYSEYRGHGMTREIGPGATSDQQLVTTNFFYQDDARHGRTSTSIVSVLSYPTGSTPRPFETTTWADYDGAWDYGGAQPALERLAGDVAAKVASPAQDWSHSFYRSEYSLTSGESVLVQFRVAVTDTNTQAILSLNSDTPDYRRWGVKLEGSTLYLHKCVNSSANCDLTTGGTTLLSSVSPDRWYVLLLTVDSHDNDHFLVRVWERENPAKVGRHEEDLSDWGGRSWRFMTKVNNNTLWLDEYSEGRIYSVNDTLYATDAPVQPPDSERRRCKYNSMCVDLVIYWPRVTQDKTMTFEGDGQWVGRSTYYRYEPAYQGNTQYGNLTHQIESRWNGSTFQDYRLSWTQYYPNTTGVYLVGLPGYTNQYACPSGSQTGGCYDAILALMNSANYYAGAYLRSSAWNLYDGHTLYSDPPTAGHLSGQRTFIRFAEANYSDPRYSDQTFGYDTWGNRTTTTAYTFEGTYSALASTGAQTTTMCYGTFTWSSGTCADDGYRTYAQGTINSIGHKAAIGYDKSLGVPTSMTDPNNTVTTAAYDSFGRLLTIRRPGDESGQATASVSYHEQTAPFLNKPFWTEANQRTDGTTYHTVRKYYNGLGQLLQTQVVSASVGTNTRHILVDYYHDEAGQLKRQSVPYGVTPGSTYHVRDTSQAATKTTYDVLGRTWIVTATDNTTATMTYYDLETRVSDARGNTTRTLNDIWGRTSQVIPPTGPTVKYTYDELDRLITAVRGGVTTTLTYDAASRKIQMIDPDMGTWTYSYDALGNLKYQDDARTSNDRLCLYYDGLNRVTSKYYTTSPTACPSSPALNVSYIYDAGTNGKGRRTSMSDASGSTTWNYDVRGRLITETKTITGTGSGTFKTQWSYNSADQVTAMRYPGDNAGNLGETVTYNYYRQMALNSVSGSATYVQSSTYDVAGRIDTRILGNNLLKTDYDYYAWTSQGGRLRYLKGGLVSNPTSLQSLEYAYDAVGDVDWIKDWKAGNPQLQDFGIYDSLNRLTSATASGGTSGYGDYPLETYTYNNTTGNLASKAGVNYTYGAQSASCPDGALSKPHAVVTAGSNTYCYDRNGNMNKRVVGGSTYTLTYDAENRLTGTSGAANANFVYDGDGNRVKSTTGNTMTIYIGNYFEAEFASPAAPSGLSATAASSTQINLAWTDNSNNEDGFKIERSPNGTSNWTQIATVGANVTTYPNSGLSCGTTYYYRVRAYNNAVGNSSYSNTANATTICAPSNLSATPASSTQINLAWTDNSNNETGFRIERSLDGTSNWTQIATVAANVTTYPNIGLSCNTTYYYRVRAYNASGNSDYSNTANATTLLCAPSNLNATAASSTQINLSWTDNSNNETGFKIERSSEGLGGADEWVQVATVGANMTVYFDAGLICNTKYYYRVRAYNAAGNSSHSNIANATTLTASLCAPSSLSATIISPTQINLAWTDNSNGPKGADNGNNEDGFKIERSFGILMWTQIATVGANVTEYTDTDLDSGDPVVYYRVRAYNKAENSEYSNVARATYAPSLRLSLPGESASPSEVTSQGEQPGKPPSSGGAKAYAIGARTDSTALLSDLAPRELAPNVQDLPVSSGKDDAPSPELERALVQTSSSTPAMPEGTPPNGITWRSYYYGGSQRVAMRVQTAAQNETYYLLGDHLGSTSITANASGSKVAEMRYKPWGETRYSSGATPTTYRYTGQRQEAGIGLYYYGARWYDPALGRFAQADSIVPGSNGSTIDYDQQMSVVPLTVDHHEIGLLMQLNQENAFTQQHGSWNQLSVEERQQAKNPFGPTNPQVLDRYAYCLNNPLRYTDPTGHESGGNADFGWEQNGSKVRLWFFGEEMTFDLDKIDAEAISHIENFKNAADAYVSDGNTVAFTGAATLATTAAAGYTF
ncbi:hypothetical protein ANRL4_03903, partial [Anaerolineae bacterium]